MAEDGAHDANDVSAAARFPAGARRAARYAQTGSAVIPPHCVRRAGVEPARPKTPVPETGAATSYATSAYAREGECDRPDSNRPSDLGEVER